MEKKEISESKHFFFNPECPGFFEVFVTLCVNIPREGEKGRKGFVSLLAKKMRGKGFKLSKHSRLGTCETAGQTSLES